jgi:hypothetical protein
MAKKKPAKAKKKVATKPAKKSKAPAAKSGKLNLSPRAGKIILGTRKGTIVLERKGGNWRMAGFSHPGVGVSYAAKDPRSGALWACLEHGHWGPKLSRSDDGGKTWRDTPQIKYPEGTRYIDGWDDGGSNESTAAGDAPKKPKFKPGKVLKLWGMSFAGADKPGRIHVGTIPGGLFTSDDDGENFSLNMPLWNHESRGGDLSNGEGLGKSHWFGGGATVGAEYAAGIHSIAIDPRDSNRYMVAVSCAGVLETRDDGRTWQGRNKGLLATFLPKPDVEWGHDPHFMSWCPSNTDHVWQQNHCGIFYSNDGARTWQPVSKEGKVAHFGFPVAVDEEDGRRAWVVPGKADDSRMAIDGKLRVCRSDDGGKSRREQTRGLPQKGAYGVVYRHALDIAGSSLVFGSTTGNLYLSDNKGESWASLGGNFPPIYSVRFA